MVDNNDEGDVGYMKKNNIIIMVIVIFLVIVVSVTAYLNKENVAIKKQLNNDAIFTVYDDGEELNSYNMSDIQAMGEVGFNANLKTNGKDPIAYDYTGVLLKTILEDAGVSFEGKSAVIVSAIDGYVVSVSLDKVMEDDNVYLAYMREGELIGTREEGGKGPYQMIISKDPFSQYWCKYAYSAELK